MNWFAANQRYLMAALALVRRALEDHCARAKEPAGENAVEPPRASASLQALRQQAASELPAPAALEVLCVTFGLSPFERDVLLLCAGMELDSRFAAQCAAAQGDPSRPFPTFSLALAALSEPHWSALTPRAPLRRWRLIEVGSGPTITTSPLRIDETILHYLSGVPHQDERLAGLIEPLHTAQRLAPSDCALAEKLAEAWTRGDKAAPLPVLQLCGGEHEGKFAIASALCDSLQLQLCVASSGAIPLVTTERDALRQLWERDAALRHCALLVDADGDEAADAAHAAALANWIEQTRSPLLLALRERRAFRGRPEVVVNVTKPTPAEQRELWHQALSAAPGSLNGKIDALVSQFNLSAPTIYAACTHAVSTDELWEECRARSRPRLAELAQRIQSAARWDDLILPEPQRQILREIAMHVRQRFRVYETWGFAAKETRGLGISALFAGASGTGKTMAVEVLANELNLDLYRIDLSSVISKYIGETEKNLRRVFDAAEDGGAILLFDEADALFGKRSEVKDSHDRYANMEISYLLQRMEAYRGLAILTTNMKEALDTAFLRRLRFVVQFPFPNATQRTEIWRRIFPAKTPTADLDLTKLARLNVAGGNIRNVVLNAAFLAAAASGPVSMHHLLQAARSEYAKLEKPLTESEIGGWT